MGHARALEADVKLRPLAYLLLPLFLVAGLLKLYKVSRQQNTQIIHVHWILPNGPIATLVARIRKIPYVISLHGSDIYVARKHRSFGIAARWVLENASAVTACSEELKQAATELGAQESPTLITWGADPARFKPKSRDLQLLAGLGLTEKSQVVFALGRLVHKKGFDILLRSWEHIARQFPLAKLIIGGDGPLQESLIKLASQLGLRDQVIFCGLIPWDRVPDYFSISDIFVLPSIQDSYGNIDGLPTVLLEAMSYGLPVIASHIGGVPRVITDRKNGLLIPPHSESAQIEAITYLLENDAVRERLGNQARKTVISRHNWENVAKKFITIFDESL
jgi:glycosyltransferase involved in cell wall biosynthesis